MRCELSGLSLWIYEETGCELWEVSLWIYEDMECELLGLSLWIYEEMGFEPMGVKKREFKRKLLWDSMWKWGVNQWGKWVWNSGYRESNTHGNGRGGKYLGNLQSKPRPREAYPGFLDSTHDVVLSWRKAVEPELWTTGTLWRKPPRLFLYQDSHGEVS